MDPAAAPERLSGGRSLESAAASSRVATPAPARNRRRDGGRLLQGSAFSMAMSPTKSNMGGSLLIEPGLAFALFAGRSMVAFTLA
jgi:hypothetical protein